MKKLSNRLKDARKAAGMDQQRWAEVIGVGYRSLQDYEAGNSVPGGKVIAAVAKQGVNANWLLLGEGEMYRAKEEAAASTSGLDADRLRDVLKTVEEIVAEQALVLDAAKKAELVTLLYEIIAEEESGEIDKARVAKMIRLAS